MSPSWISSLTLTLTHSLSLSFRTTRRKSNPSKWYSVFKNVQSYDIFIHTLKSLFPLIHSPVSFCYIHIYVYIYMHSHIHIIRTPIMFTCESHTLIASLIISFNSLGMIVSSSLILFLGMMSLSLSLLSSVSGMMSLSLSSLFCFWDDVFLPLVI